MGGNASVIYFFVICFSLLIDKLEQKTRKKKKKNHQVQCYLTLTKVSGPWRCCKSRGLARGDLQHRLQGRPASVQWLRSWIYFIFSMQRENGDYTQSKGQFTELSIVIYWAGHELDGCTLPEYICNCRLSQWSNTNYYTSSREDVLHGHLRSETFQCSNLNFQYTMQCNSFLTVPPMYFTALPINHTVTYHTCCTTSVRIIPPITTPLT